MPRNLIRSSRMVAKMANFTTEDQLQRAIVDALRLRYPLAVIHHADATCRSVREGARRKRLGTLAGFPDLIVIHAGRIGFLEVKTLKGRLTKVQKELHGLLASNLASVFVVRSVPEALRAVASLR